MISKTTQSRQLLITEPDRDRLRDMAKSPRYRVSHSILLAGLREELDRGQVVAAAGVPKAVVTMNSRVRLRDLASGQREIYTLVYPPEADIDTNRLSVLAPLGSALLGSRAGQTIKVNAPGGVRRLKVERILYQPEASGDFDL
jgi:regulator of nucleoside diphosphate kinase